MKIKVEGGRRHERLELVNRIRHLLEQDKVNVNVREEEHTVFILTPTDLFATMRPRR